MKSKALLNLFLVDLNLPGSLRLEESETAAMLFGTDEIKVDVRKGAIRFPDLGWLKCDLGGLSGAFDWAAVVKEEGGWNVVMGRGNPYDPKLSYCLPHKNGRILAMPHVAVTKFFQMESERVIGEA